MVRGTRLELAWYNHCLLYTSVWLSWDIPADAAPGAYEVAVTARAVEEQRMPNGVLYRDADAAGLAFTCRFTLCVGLSLIHISRRACPPPG